MNKKANNKLKAITNKALNATIDKKLIITTNQKSNTIVDKKLNFIANKKTNTITNKAVITNEIPKKLNNKVVKLRICKWVG